MAQEGYLHIWGKNYPQPVQLCHKVLYAAAGENHVIFTTCNSTIIQLLETTTEWVLTASGSWVSRNRNSTISPFLYFNIMSLLPCSVGRNIASSSLVLRSLSDKNQVYSCRINIKGRLGHYHFENQTAPKIVAGLLPFGTKNSKSNKYYDQAKYNGSWFLNTDS